MIMNNVHELFQSLLCENHSNNYENVIRIPFYSNDYLDENSPNYGRTHTWCNSLKTFGYKPSRSILCVRTLNAMSLKGPVSLSRSGDLRKPGTAEREHGQILFPLFRRPVFSGGRENFFCLPSNPARASFGRRSDAIEWDLRRANECPRLFALVGGGQTRRVRYFRERFACVFGHKRLANSIETDAERRDEHARGSRLPLSGGGRIKTAGVNTVPPVLLRRCSDNVLLLLFLAQSSLVDEQKGAFTGGG